MTWLFILGGALLVALLLFGASKLGIHPFAEPYLGEPDGEPGREE